MTQTGEPILPSSATTAQTSFWDTIMTANSGAPGVDWVELRTGRAGGYRTYVSAKIIRAVGDVGVPPF